MTVARVSAAGLSVVRGGREVFRDLAFEAPAGRALLVVGPNGAGKSTLLRAIAGLVRPVAGEIVFDGADPETPPGALVHYVGHLDAVKPQLSVGENIRFWADWLGAGDEASAIERALAAVALDHLSDIPAAVLSAGQRRRLSLARVALAERPVWLLDEPSVALDAASRERLAGLVDAHVAAGGIVIAATHEALGLSATIRLSIDEMCGGAPPDAAPDRRAPDRPAGDAGPGPDADTDGRALAEGGR